MLTNPAFIFCRGGSKGVPKKNIRNCAGKPLVVWTIELALAHSRFSKVVVSTDSSDIADVCSDAGAEILIRPTELASDSSPELLSWKHAIHNYYDQINTAFCSLPATSPLRQSTDINNAFSRFESNDVDVVFGVTNSARSPYLNIVKKTALNTIELFSESTSSRRQDVPPTFDVTTIAYVAKKDFILKTSSLWQGQVGCYNVPSENSLDIDTLFDFRVAEMILKDRCLS